MNLNIIGDKLQMEWELFEQFFAFQFKRNFLIPLEHIELATIEEPQSSWSEIRAPGTFIPGLIKAGTYYTRGRKEFWYVTKQQDYLTLELKNEDYNKIILTIDQSEAWVERINQSKSARSS